MYSDDKRFTELEKKFLKAFEEFNIELLQECLDEGMDINANPSNYFLPSLLAESLEFLDEDLDRERYENWAYGDIDVKAPIIETDRIKFIKFCIEKGINLNAKEDDCGEIIYNIDEAEYQGGSGAGCSAVVFNAYIYDLLVMKKIKRVLFLATGALLSTVTTQQGESIPCISHAVSLEV